jgi:hypothetical protein
MPFLFVYQTPAEDLGQNALTWLRMNAIVGRMLENPDK